MGARSVLLLFQIDTGTDSPRGKNPPISSTVPSTVGEKENPIVKVTLLVKLDGVAPLRVRYDCTAPIDGGGEGEGDGPGKEVGVRGLPILVLSEKQESLTIL